MSAIDRKADQMDDEAAEAKARSQSATALDIIERWIVVYDYDLDTVYRNINNYYGELDGEAVEYWREIWRKAARNIYNRNELKKAQDALPKASDK